MSMPEHIGDELGADAINGESGGKAFLPTDDGLVQLGDGICGVIDVAETDRANSSSSSE